MLEADRQVLVANTRAAALSLRQRELDFVSQRFNSLAGICTIAAGFAFDSIVEFELPEDEREEGGRLTEVMLSVFYIASTITLAASIFVVADASFSLFAGYKLGLQGGKEDSIERAVAVLLVHSRLLAAISSLAMLALLTAGTALAWLKMGPARWAATVIFALTAVLIAGSVLRVRSLLRTGQTVHGDVVVNQMGAGRLNLAHMSEDTTVQEDAVVAASAPQRRHTAMSTGAIKDGRNSAAPTSTSSPGPDSERTSSWREKLLFWWPGAPAELAANPQPPAAVPMGSSVPTLRKRLSKVGTEPGSEMTSLVLAPAAAEPKL